ncbi:DUF2139 domain-containing protein [Staphylothermus hellenicus]|uniref:Uncharacterized conserved protein UCP016666 n=1 Tax=Staphylothermus hellenicus (strain DSM 12710 / JCM 10830 / BK20S6-10-b1 / P8) TaxID=591019 RepID=D7D9J6_STAHD|nr:DUF2139 domain-containing protein [Staphylothermus hellenicus]ADI32442.1 Uncharacterized conserved protein UCP016666 [Staphylothermus hellenicus DSM 12710]
MTRIIDYLSEYPPNYGPEWGSGGIFGLKYHKGVLYYMLAFEAQGYFIDHDGIRKIYEFEKLGLKPVSGGDTYNAVYAIDDSIYFGGWVHAPAIYRGRTNKGATIDFRNKYSHVHKYDIGNNEVSLIWKESIHDPEKWVGEISEIIYDPYEQKLLLARADGHINLGVYELDPLSGKIRKILDEPALKGAINLDYACFSIHYFPKSFNGIECIDLIERKTIIDKFDPSKYTIDKGDVRYPLVGPVASLYGRVFAFMKGGVLVYNPVLGEKYFVRLLDIPYSQLGPARANAKVLGGGVIVPYNMFVHSVINPTNEFEEKAKKATNTIISPTLLLYIAPPLVKIIGAFGARITGVEVIGDHILLAHNTMANTYRYDASPYDQGIRGFTALNTSIINSSPPQATIVVPGWMIKDKVFGGIPLTGYKDPELIIITKKENKLTINEYMFTLPPMLTHTEKININSGRNRILLNNYSGIVSFKFDKGLSENDVVIIHLK